MNLLVTGAWQSANENLSRLEQLGHHIVFMHYENDELPCDYEWVEGVICNGIFLSHPIEKFTNLRYIQLTSAGFDRVPMDYVKEKNIEIHNARGVYSIPMAEFAICGVLDLYKQSRFFTENQKNHKWEKHRGLLELFGKTVLIVGCGSVGTECAKRFKAFGCNIIGVDIYPRDDENYAVVKPFDELDSALALADVIILTLPLTEQTKRLINDNRINKMKTSAILVNIARGAVIDTTALIKAIEKKKISGAVLDVFEEEPLDINNKLWNMNNIILTPHNSFVGENNAERLEKIILGNIWEKIDGNY